MQHCTSISHNVNTSFNFWNFITLSRIFPRYPGRLLSQITRGAHNPVDFEPSFNIVLVSLRQCLSLSSAETFTRRDWLYAKKDREYALADKEGDRTREWGRKRRATVEGIRRYSLVQWGFANRSLNPGGGRINPRKMWTCPYTLSMCEKHIAKSRFVQWFYLIKLPRRFFEAIVRTLQNNRIYHVNFFLLFFFFFFTRR